ncbi:hypothetical protein D5086_007428 [Populus alba]|uniref:Uncharacterized protein n=3 Tax=Populus TaxID=3689 RepID=A0A4U5QE02_POPAL|nr:DNA-3-methyladenine glycosylase 1-like [Populus alba]KAJ7004809.1 DNA-3-methyladenine glycosylase 1-like [Populus alba x Populus x berolinensis]TKS08748.1 uncharacterized protein D5086_0000100470 [Populus alba]
MSGGPPRVRAMNSIREPENKEPEKPATKKKPTNEKQPPQETESNNKSKKKCGIGKFVVLRQKSMNASCSSYASSESSSPLSRASSSSSSWSSGRTAVRRNAVMVRNKQCGGGGGENEVLVGDNSTDDFQLQIKKRCAWVTPTTDPSYATFHDEEWGVPVNDDKKLFELLSLSGALAELTWPLILNKRHIFREVFLDFDPIDVSKLNEKRIAVPGSPASSLLSELKLRSIIENARQICKVTDEFGSFDKYIWNFVNHKPIISQFRYSRQVPVKTPKAELISKDLVKRGFRSVSPTVIYSFMQVAGLTNDHLINCFRFQECTTKGEARVKDDYLEAKTKVKELEDPIDVGLSRAVDD